MSTASYNTVMRRLDFDTTVKAIWASSSEPSSAPEAEDRDELARDEGDGARDP